MKYTLITAVIAEESEYNKNWEETYVSNRILSRREAESKILSLIDNFNKNARPNEKHRRLVSLDLEFPYRLE